MNNKLWIPASALILLAGCDYNERNFEGLDEMTKPSNILSLDYTLLATDYAALSGNPKSNQYFTTSDSPDDYLPKWLGKTYYTACATSTARITYDFKQDPSALLAQYNTADYLALEKNEDYTPVYGEGYYAPYLNASSESQIAKILTARYPEAVADAKVMVAYKYNENGVPQQMETPIAQYNFEDQTVNTAGVDKLTGGWFVSAVGGNKWSVRTYDNNIYLQFSANGAAGACEAWLISPAVTVSGDDKKVAFDVNVGYWNHDCLSVFVSTNFDGKDASKATWEEITADFTIPQTDKYAGFASAGEASLASYAGKKVYIGFKYVGEGPKLKTTTYQIDNVVIGKDIPKVVNTTDRFAFYNYTGKKWEAFKNKANVFCLTQEEYAAMGAPGVKSAFSSANKPEAYLPSFLNQKYAYPMANDSAVVVYNYLSDKNVMSTEAEEYVYSATNKCWEVNSRIIPMTRQYAFDGSEWMFDPSMNVILSTSKSDKATSAFYQAITDWVKENKGTDYVTSYGNNDYYYGGSAYQNNFDFRTAKWREQYAAAYADLTDAELTALMMSRLEEAFIPGLKASYPDAAPVDGVHVFYSVTFSIYDGSSTKQWTIKYEVTGNAEFTYVKDSLQEIK